MKLLMMWSRLDKLLQAFQSLRFLRALCRYRVLGGSEHRYVLSRDIATVIDIGANRGQFALAARRWVPNAHVISFEPLPGPASIFRKLFFDDFQVILHQSAIGPRPEQRMMHVSGRDDSSSLLPISSMQTSLFPGTSEVIKTVVRVGPLEEFVPADELRSPVMLKLDVQGFEYDALIGCESMLSHFDWVYCECSFVEFYLGQKLARDVIEWLADRGLQLDGVYNVLYDSTGQSVQADFLFHRVETAATL